MVQKDPADRYQSAEELTSDLEMSKIGGAGNKDGLPSTRSQILHVITAEKGRIAQLEDEVASFQSQRRFLIILMIIPWTLTVLLVITLVLTLVFSK